jgi:hypothetical protein
MRLLLERECQRMLEESGQIMVEVAAEPVFASQLTGGRVASSLDLRENFRDSLRGVWGKDELAVRCDDHEAVALERVAKKIPFLLGLRIRRRRAPGRPNQELLRLRVAPPPDPERVIPHARHGIDESVLGAQMLDQARRDFRRGSAGTLELCLEGEDALCQFVTLAGNLEGVRVRDRGPPQRGKDPYAVNREDSVANDQHVGRWEVMPVRIEITGGDGDGACGFRAG